MRLFCAVAAALFAEGLLSSTSVGIVNLANGGFACDIRYHIIGVCLSSFACRPATEGADGEVRGSRSSLVRMRDMDPPEVPLRQVAEQAYPLI